MPAGSNPPAIATEKLPPPVALAPAMTHPAPAMPIAAPPTPPPPVSPPGPPPAALAPPSGLVPTGSPSNCPPNALGMWSTDVTGAALFVCRRLAPAP